MIVIKIISLFIIVFYTLEYISIAISRKINCKLGLASVIRQIVFTSAIITFIILQWNIL